MLVLVFYLFTRLSQKFCYIFIYATLWRIYYMTEAIEGMKGTHLGK